MSPEIIKVRARNQQWNIFSGNTEKQEQVKRETPPRLVRSIILYQTACLCVTQAVCVFGYSYSYQPFILNIIYNGLIYIIPTLICIIYSENSRLIY